MQKVFPKNKYLLDENQHEMCAECLKKLGFRAVSVKEMGLKGKQDEEIVSFAKKKGLILISSDRGLMNHQRHPLHCCKGIVVIPAISSQNDVPKRMARVCHATGYGSFDGHKIQLRDNSFSITYCCSECGGKLVTDEEEYGNCEICKRQTRKLKSSLQF